MTKKEFTLQDQNQFYTLGNLFNDITIEEIKTTDLKTEKFISILGSAKLYDLESEQFNGILPSKIFLGSDIYENLKRGFGIFCPVYEAKGLIADSYIRMEWD